jgi:hypothetical protein
MQLASRSLPHNQALVFRLGSQLCLLSEPSRRVIRTSYQAYRRLKIENSASQASPLLSAILHPLSSELRAFLTERPHVDQSRAALWCATPAVAQRQRRAIPFE